MSPWQRRLEYALRVAGNGIAFAMFGIGCTFVSLVAAPLIRLTSPDTATTQRRVRRCVQRCYQFMLVSWRALGAISYELHGRERLAAPGQLVVCNHPSLIDVLFIASQVPQVDCIVKDALLRNPFLGPPVRWAGYIPNSAPDRLIQNCVATLKAGNSLVIFPEGTRSVPGQPLRMKRGAAHVALAAGCDLLPVTIVCRPSSLTKADVWYRVPPQRPHWCVTVGEPIRLSQLAVAGESSTRAARRVTAYLEEYFTARIAVFGPLAKSAPADDVPAQAGSAATS